MKQLITFNVCITHPSLHTHGLLRGCYNLELYCNCGKKYIEHESWQHVHKKQQQIIEHETAKNTTKDIRSITNG